MADSGGTWGMVLEDIEHCNKCGFCLPACPTYQLTGNELASPRGRIAMVEAAARGEIEVGEGLQESLQFCLACRACETACPSGVQYHKILEAGRASLRAHHQSPRLTWASRRMLSLVRHPKWLPRAMRAGESIKALPLMSALKPLIPMMGYRPGQVAPFRGGEREPTVRVAFFEGCVMGAVFPDANQAAVNLLKRGGLTPQLVPRQGCCGALHLHSGDRSAARQMARENIEAFEMAGDEPIVNTAGGCGAMLMGYAELLEDDAVWAERARAFSARIRDWASVFRPVSAHVPMTGTGLRAILQNSCHLVNVEHAGDDAVFLASHVDGDTLVPYQGQDRCCGSAGIYNIENPEWAAAILDSKMLEVQTVQPDCILVNNPGCHLQMRWGVERAGLVQTEVQHLATYLERCAQRAEAQGKGEISDSQPRQSGGTRL